MENTFNYTRRGMKIFNSYLIGYKVYTKITKSYPIGDKIGE